MKFINLFLQIILRFLELVLLLSVSFFIVYEISVCDNRISFLDDMSHTFVGMLWLFPISIPLIVCVLTSLVNSMSLKTIYAKVIFCIHLFNILSPCLIILILPSEDEPTANMMAQNYRTHQKEISNLIECVDSLSNEMGGFEFVIVDNKISKLSIKKGNRWINKEQVEALWRKGEAAAGFTPNQSHKLSMYLQSANIKGVFTDPIEPSRLLLYQQWGKTDFFYKIYKSNSVMKRDKATYLNDKSFILFNDTIAFVRYGVYPGNGAFKDYDLFCHLRLRD